MQVPADLPGAPGGEDAPLRRLAACAQRFGDADLARQALDWAERLAEGRFYVACLGQFKRGKSTLLDALAGDRLLPAGVVPVTAVPTVVRYGPQRHARVRWRSGAWEEVPVAAIADYVAQDRNPDNRKQVMGVEVFTPAPLLAGGLCLVDTPGLGSVFGANTEAARTFLPHVDAALVVLGADPPLTGAELEWVSEVAEQTRDLIFVLNKMDRASAEDRAAAAAFARQELEQRLRRPIGPIYEVSALQAGAGGAPGPGWSGLVTALERLANQAGLRLRQAAAARGLMRLRGQLLRALEQEREALRRPLRETEDRATALRQIAVGAARAQADLGALMAVEQQRLVRHCRERRHEFLSQARPAAQAALQSALAALPRRSGPGFRRAALAAAQAAARQPLMPWLAAQQNVADAEFRRANQRFEELAREYLRANPDLVPEAEAFVFEAGLRQPSAFAFAEFLSLAEPASPLRWVGDAALGLVHAWGWIERDALRFLDLLLDTNAHRVQSDLDQRAAASRRMVQQELGSLLGRVAAQAERACDRARQAHASGAAAVAARLDFILALEAEVPAAVGNEAK